MSRNEELPPIGLPIQQRSSSGYFFGILGAIALCGAAAFGLGYGWLQLSTGHCDERYSEPLAALDAEVEFFRTSDVDTGLSSVELHDLRSSARLAKEALIACCEQQEDGGAGEAAFAACDAQVTEIAAVQGRLAAARERPNAMYQTVLTAAKRLRAISYDLEDVVEGKQPSAPGNVAAPPPE